MGVYVRQTVTWGACMQESKEKAEILLNELMSYKGGWSRCNDYRFVEVVEPVQKDKENGGWRFSAKVKVYVPFWQWLFRI